jgi:hypothetical protein
MSIYTPYTYLIGWSHLDLWYYGSRYASDCHPDDLWKTYFTSSKNVKEIRKKYGEPDIIEIRKTFSTSEQARLWEIAVIRRLKIVKDKRWLNKRNPGGLGAFINKIGSIPWNKGRKGVQKNSWKGKTGRYSEEHRLNLAYKSSKEYKSDDTRRKHSETVSGEGNPCYGKRWMNKDGKHKRVDTNEILYYISIGYNEGRIINRNPKNGKFMKETM